jgi:hypothetical protein
MARWGFWDWVAYVCLGIAAFGLAAGAALKEDPMMLSHLPSLFASPRWAYVPIVLFALGSAILAIRFTAPLLGPSQGPANTPAPALSSAEAPADRIFVDTTSKFLFDLVKGQTHFQRKKITEIYMGKWLKVSGPVSNVQALSSGRSVVSVGLDDVRQLSLWFDTKWSERVGLLMMGQNVSAIGKINNISGIEIEMEDCELLPS